MALVYKVTNRISGKMYIGMTGGTLRTRRRAHLKYAKKPDRLPSPFHDALKRYEPDTFTWEVVAEGITRTQANRLEERLISELQTQVSHTPGGYNIRSGGETQGHSEETKAKLSAARKGKRMSDEARAAISKGCQGRVNSPECRAKISAAKTGVKRPGIGKNHGDMLRAFSIAEEVNAQILLALGATGRAVAEWLGVVPATISRLKNGHRGYGRSFA